MHRIGSAENRSATGSPHGPAAARGEATPRWLVVVGIVLAAINLRPAVTSLGAVLDEVIDAFHMPGAVAGLLTTLPALCFALFGWTAPALAHRFGPYRVMASATVAMLAGLALRVSIGSAVLFVVTSAFALAGVAAANVLLPVLVKSHFPQHVGLMTGVYTTMLAVGTTLPATLTVPAEHTFGGSWRLGLGMWTVLAALALLPWLGLARWRGTLGTTGGARAGVPGVRLTRSPIAWALAVYFGTQSLQAYVVFGWLPQLYRDAGFSPRIAGLLLGGVTVLGIPMGLTLPGLASRHRDQRAYIAGIVACYAVGYAGLAVTPAAGAWAWAFLLGVGGGAFPLALTMIGLRARTGAGTAALSGFAQSIGYLIAASGPLVVGAIYGATGGWDAPLALLGASLIVMLASGLLAARPRYVEDGAKYAGDEA